MSRFTLSAAAFAAVAYAGTASAETIVVSQAITQEGIVFTK